MKRPEQSNSNEIHKIPLNKLSRALSVIKITTQIHVSSPSLFPQALAKTTGGNNPVPPGFFGVCPALLLPFFFVGVAVGEAKYNELLGVSGPAKNTSD